MGSGRSYLNPCGRFALPPTSKQEPERTEEREREEELSDKEAGPHINDEVKAEADREDSAKHQRHRDPDEIRSEPDVSPRVPSGRKWTNCEWWWCQGWRHGCSSLCDACTARTRRGRDPRSVRFDDFVRPSPDRSERRCRPSYSQPTQRLRRRSIAAWSGRPEIVCSTRARLWVLVIRPDCVPRVDVTHAEALERFANSGQTLPVEVFKANVIGVPTSFPSCDWAKRTSARCTASLPHRLGVYPCTELLASVHVGADTDQIEADLDRLDDLEGREEADAAIVESCVREPVRGRELCPARVLQGLDVVELLRDCVAQNRQEGLRRRASARSMAAVTNVTPSASSVTRKSRRP